MSQVHYGCHEFREDTERVLQGRAHPELARLYHTHLACCRDCQRYHHRLEAIYRRPRPVTPLDTFAREREFGAILERAKSHGERHGRARALRRASTTVGVGGLTIAAVILALALVVPSFGARLFQPPAVAQLELRSDTGYTSYGDGIRIPVGHSLSHQAQKFARVIGWESGWDAAREPGGRVELTDAEGRPTTGDSLTVGTRIATRDTAVQVAFVGRLIANFQPHTIARWNSASPSLVEFGLLSGTLAVRYDRRPGDPILQVRTPHAVVRVVGTVFTVTVEDGRTSVSVLRGKVVVVDPSNGRPLGEVEAGFRFDVGDSSYRDVGRQEVAAALPLSELGELLVTISDAGEMRVQPPPRELGQIPRAWTVPGLSNDPSQRILDRVLDPDAPTASTAPTAPTALLGGEVAPATGRAAARAAHRAEPARHAPADDNGEAATRKLINKQIRRERDRKSMVEARLERCRVLQAEPETRFRAARCLGDFMSELGDQPEAVEGLLLLGTLRMDFAHDYQSATRNFEEFLRRAPQHPKAELARYKLVLAAIEAGYIPHALQRGLAYLRHYPDGQYVGRILQRFPELKSEI
ncbi:FecR domain-containing protein [Enhygromyxa salina]|uniref:FecR protein n=1 Tax=Enhygromyxa salina TaxID=215803 RepID=A0A2S9YC28_9BACT|nr:FecR domain-containing protein [Enhygromyxa salina]PRQ02612.1 FecR protein [Enhygromyxa salina]